MKIRNSWFYGRAFFKGTVSVISSNSSCIDDSARFTTVPLKPSSDQACFRYRCFCFFKLFIFVCGFSAKVTCAFLAETIEKLIEINTFRVKKTMVSSTFLIRLRFQGFRGILGVGIFALEISLIVPLTVDI